MEYETSQDAGPLTRCLEMVEESQVYIGLIGQRYGTVPEDQFGEALSMTEREFDHATKLWLQRIVLFGSGDDIRGVNNIEAVQRFRSKIGKQCWVDNFSNEDDAAAVVSHEATAISNR